MKIYLTRHGRTNYNDLDLCNADPAVDVHLTPAGVAQTELLADKLRDVPIGHIYVSELRRTVQTADILNAFHHAPVEVDPRLDDIRSGFEGRLFSEYMQALDAAENKWTVRFNGGESIEDVKKRAANFIADVQQKDYDTVLVVTSEWIIRAMLIKLHNLTNEEAWDLRISQGGYIEV